MTIERGREVVGDEIKQAEDTSTLVCGTTENGDKTVFLKSFPKACPDVINAQCAVFKVLLDEFVRTLCRIFDKAVSKVFNYGCVLFGNGDGSFLSALMDFISLVFNQVDDAVEFFGFTEGHNNRYKV